MLHFFRFKNFYSFRDDTRVSLAVSEHVRGSSLVVEREGFPRLSKALAVMGANGSGKTNVLKVLAFTQWFLSHSFQSAPDAPIPFESHFFAAEDPTEIEVVFDFDGRIYRYELALNRRRVLREALFHKTSRAFSSLFVRTWQGDGYHYKQAGFGLSSREATKARENASIIATAAQYDVPMARRIAGLPIRSNVAVWGRVHPSLSDLGVAADYFLESPAMQERMVDLLRQWDLGLAGVRIKRETINMADGKEQNIAIAYGIHDDDAHRRELTMVQESGGTQRAFVLLSWLLPVLETGGLAVIDEMESDLHPHMLAEVLDLFLNPSTNPRNAQVIFSTHSAEVMRQLRKPQIGLVEKDEHCSSDIWRLDEVRGVRADDNLYAKYMAGAYGAVPYMQ